MKEKRV